MEFTNHDLVPFLRAAHSLSLDVTFCFEKCTAKWRISPAVRLVDSFSLRFFLETERLGIMDFGALRKLLG